MSTCLAEPVRSGIFRVALTVAVCTAVQSSACADDADLSQSRVASGFLEKFCLQCHDTDTAEGEREFESFTLPISSKQQLITVDEIIDQVTLGIMPPEDSEQPTVKQRLALIGVLRDSIKEARGRFESSGSRTVMRRLSDREYENTLATLFDRRVDTLGLTADFPKEETSQQWTTSARPWSRPDFCWISTFRRPRGWWKLDLASR